MKALVVYANKSCYILNLMEQKPNIQFSDFKKIDIRVGTITSCEAVEGSNKLLKLDVDFGVLGQRQILVGISAWYQPDELVGLQTTFVLNMEPRTIMGLESQGMLLAVDLGDDGKPAFLEPDREIPNGSGAI